MKFYLFIYLFIYLIGCKEVKENELPSKKFDTVVQSASNDDFNHKKNKVVKNSSLIDTLSIEQVKFNNNPFKISFSNLLKKEIDSIVDSNWECGNPFGWEGENFKEYYIKGAKYITNDNEAILCSAYFLYNNKITLKINNNEIILNDKTTVEYISNIFSNSEVINLPNNYYTYVSFNKQVPENHWEFHYNSKGHLIRFELYWWLC